MTTDSKVQHGKVDLIGSSFTRVTAQFGNNTGEADNYNDTHGSSEKLRIKPKVDSQKRDSLHVKSLKIPKKVSDTPDVK